MKLISKNKTINNTLEILKRKYFLQPDGKNIKDIQLQFTSAVESLVKNQGKSAHYPVTTGLPSYKQIINQAKIPQHLNNNPTKYLANIHRFVQGMVKAGNPFMVKNIIPTASIPSLSANFAVSMYMPNGVTGEDAGQSLLAEIACSAAIAKLAGLDHKKASGVFTFGGTGTNLYAIKIGLYKALPLHFKNGIKEDVVVIESAPAHYSHKTAAVWLGIGENNVVKVKSNPDQTTNSQDLENKCRKILKEGKKIIAINGLGGTTSNMGIDDFKVISNMRERLIKEFQLNYKPHIHADSVLGWAFLVFKDYDFAKNPFSFSDRTIALLKKILKRIETLQYVDSFGIDFHKSGYVSYTSSMIIVKNKDDLLLLKRDKEIMTPLFHDEKSYNPGMFTLETSRSSANILATWVALQTFGIEGYQALLGHALEMSFVFRDEIELHSKEGLYIANQHQYGADVFVRCYAPYKNPKKEYKNEMYDNALLEENNKYTTNFYNWLEKNVHSKNDEFAISKSSAAIYTHTSSPMIALRIYPLSPYITKASAQILIKLLAKYKKQFDAIVSR